jgi:hypothetical protein
MRKAPDTNSGIAARTAAGRRHLVFVTAPAVP